jgi:hypothetical protein
LIGIKRPRTTRLLSRSHRRLKLVAVEDLNGTFLDPNHAVLLAHFLAGRDGATAVSCQPSSVKKNRTFLAIDRRGTFMSVHACATSPEQIVISPDSQK